MSIPRIPDWLRQELEASKGADDAAIPFTFQTPSGSDAPEKNTENKRQQNSKRVVEENVTGLTFELAANGPAAVEVSMFSTAAGSGAQAPDLSLPMVLEMLRQRAEMLVR